MKILLLLIVLSSNTAWSGITIKDYKKNRNKLILKEVSQNNKESISYVVSIKGKGTLIRKR